MHGISWRVCLAVYASPCSCVPYAALFHHCAHEPPGDLQRAPKHHGSKCAAGKQRFLIMAGLCISTFIKTLFDIEKYSCLTPSLPNALHVCRIPYHIRYISYRWRKQCLWMICPLRLHRQQQQEQRMLSSPQTAIISHRNLSWWPAR